VIGLPVNTRVWIVAGHTDMRKLRTSTEHRRGVIACINQRTAASTRATA
jgi:hypothetical protein